MAVYRKQQNEDGIYVTKDQEVQDEQGNTTIIPGGVHYEVISCERTESKEWYETGEFETFQDEQGNEVKTPIMAERVVINKGWDAFDSLEAALEGYGLREMTDEEKAAWEEEKAQKAAAEMEAEAQTESVGE